MTDQEKFDILNNEFNKLKIGDPVGQFIKVYEEITGTNVQAALSMSYDEHTQKG
jgi:hypothetical protein